MSTARAEASSLLLPPYSLARGLRLGRDGVLQTQARKAREVRIVGMQLGLMFNGQSGQMRVRSQWPTSGGCQSPAQNGEMLRPRIENGDARLHEPGFDPPKGIGGSGRRGKNAAGRTQSKKP